tara:strand:+ start:178 stop:1299 length:1122 start_codon:yes stop_codon:yes gene_type:complete
MAVNQKPSLAARIFQGGGSAGLLGDPLFNIGMGLLAKGQDNRIPYATAVMGGLQDAQSARTAAAQREMLRQQQERDARLEALRLQEILEKRQRDELAMQQGQQRTQAFNRAVDARFPNLRPPMINAGQPDPRAGLLRALGPDAVPAKVMEGLLAPQGQTRFDVQPPSPKDYTNESLEAFAQSGDYSVLVPRNEYSVVQNRDGTATVIDKRTGKVVSGAGVSAGDVVERGKEFKRLERGDPDYKDSVFEAIDNIKSVRDDPELKNILGVFDSTVVGAAPIFASQEEIDLNARLNQVIAKAKMAQRGELKGQGTISDFEARMLGESITALTDRNISPDMAVEELNALIARIERTLNRADRTTTKSGRNLVPVGEN